MRVVMAEAIPEILRWRKTTGADRFDEMWEGELHMAAAPNLKHQAHAKRILRFFVEVWEPRTGGEALLQVNVSTADRWDRDYRIPDVAVVTAERRGGEDDPFCRPAAVFAVRSPGDESYEKLPFYAAVGVEAVAVVDRDTLAAQVYALAQGGYVAVPPGADGWTEIAPIGVEVRTDTTGDRNRLLLRMKGEPATERAV
jgi:Uma2 family endonuclease